MVVKMVQGTRKEITQGSEVGPTCLTCRHFRLPDWMSEGPATEGRMGEIAHYSRCARWRESRDASLLLVVGVALEEDEMVLCRDARAHPEMCGPLGRTWEARP